MKKSVMLYTVDEVNKIIGQINNQIESFRSLYRNKPTFIIISVELAILFKTQHDLMSQHEVIVLNGEYLEVNRIFGMTCFASPALKDLEFEIR